MLSSYSKDGLTIEVLKWDAFKNEEGSLDSHLIANVLFNGETREDIIEGPLLDYILKVSSDIGFKEAQYNEQDNKPHLYYAEAYYDIIK